MRKRILKLVLLSFVMLGSFAPLVSWAACSSLINLATINELWRQSNNSNPGSLFYEIKVLDTDLISSGEYRNWSLSICRENRNRCITGISLNDATVSNGVYLVLDENDINSRYVDFGAGLEVSLLDGSGNIIDYLSVGGYSRLGNQGCSGFLFDTTAATSNTKDLRRNPDGTGDWEHYPGASGGDTEGGSNDGGQGYPALSFQDLQVAPGEDAVVTLALSAASGSDISINYATYDGTATAGNDYVAASGSITIPAGNTSATFTVHTLPAASVGEYFHFLVSIASSSAGVATISDHTGMVTFYTVPSPVAEWQFEEPAWSGVSGEVTDSTGNGLNGTSYNGANTSNAIPPDSAITGDPGTCRFGVFDGRNTYIEMPDNNQLDISATLTVSAWINPNRYATSDLMSILSKDENYEFHLKPSGVVNWWWNDSRGRTRQFDSTTSVPLNRWTHVAIVYSQTGQTIYINGQARGSATYTNETLRTNNDPLQIGDDQLINGGARRFDGYIDEVRIYNAALSAAEIRTVMNETHPCGAATVDHFAISFGAGSASTCTSLPVTITALDAGNNVLTDYTGSIGITTSSAHGDWSATDAGGAPGIDPPVNAIDNAAADDGAALYLFDANDLGSIDLFLSDIHADDLTVAVADLATGGTTISAPISFRDNAFVISPITCTGSSCPATGSTELVAGRDHQFTAALWRRDPGTGDCAIATAYDTGSNPAYGQLQAWINRDVSDPAGGAPSIGATVLPSAAPAANNLNLSFVSGVASFALSSNDVGKYAISLRDNSSGFATANGVARAIDGSSDTLTVRPFALGFTDITSGGALNPGGTSTAGAAFTTAGEDFSATVGAYLWQAGDDVDNNGLPDNSTTDVTDNGITPAFNAATLLSADNTAGSFTPSAGIAGVIGGANTLNAFSAGVQTTNGLTYSEVGSIILLAQSNDYLGTAGVNVAGRTPGPVGRFYPHYFDISNVAITSACSSGGFSYMDQPELGIQYTVEAHRKGGGITLNYFTTGYTTGTVWLVAEDSNDGTDLSARLSNTGAASWIAGVYNLSTTTAQFDRATTADGPFDALQLGVRVSDPDGAELLNRDMKADDAADCVAAASCTARALASTQVRYGRMEIANAHGSELLPLSQALYMAYYDGSGFTLHTLDNCTSIGATDLILANDIESDQRDGTIRVGSGTSTVSVQNSPAAAGRLDLSLTAPGSTGYIDIQPDLSAAGGADLPWLLYDWDGDAGTADEAPTGRATFGIYGGNPQQIYIREQY